MPGLAAAQLKTRVEALNRPQPFFGYHRPGAKISEGVRESFWLQGGMMAGFPAAYFCIQAFSDKVYPGLPHGMYSTHKEQINADLLAFIKV